jgi:hypothetical protein
MKQKVFTVDWDNYEEVSALGCKIKSRLGEINPNRISKTQKTRLLIDACIRIYNTEISQIYKNLELNKNKNYYVYVHLDTTKKIAIGKSSITTFAATLGMEYFPFYVGKGCGDRDHILKRNENHRKIREHIQTLNKEMKVMKIVENLSELEALCVESKLIDIFGLIPFGGLLTNLDEGYLSKERRFLYKEDYDLIGGLYRMSKKKREEKLNILNEQI